VSNSPIYPPVILPTGGGQNQNSDTNSATLTFSQVKGTYNGLVFNPSDVTAAKSGYITITTSAKGAQGSFSAKLEMGGKKYSAAGPFDASGAYSGRIGPWTLHLLIDLHGADVITGDITDGNWTATLQANRAAFGKTHFTSLAGSYTLVIQPADASMGNGIGTLTVDSSGNVKWNLVLPDGTKLKESTTISKDGSWPLYSDPYKSGGLIIGWMKFGGSASDGFDGGSVWIKPAGISAIYPQGLSVGVNVSGSHYKTPPSYRAFGSSKVILNGGGLAAPVTNSVTWGSDNKVSNLSGNSLKLSVTPTTGMFQGTVATGNGTVSFQGVLFEKNDVGLGFFLGSEQSGTVSFVPNN